MNQPVQPENAPGAEVLRDPSPITDDQRHPRTPLTPARVGESIGEDADPELDVAPNLGGEEQMQDA